MVSGEDAVPTDKRLVEQLGGVEHPGSCRGIKNGHDKLYQREPIKCR